MHATHRWPRRSPCCVWGPKPIAPNARPDAIQSRGFPKEHRRQTKPHRPRRPADWRCDTAKPWAAPCLVPTSKSLCSTMERTPSHPQSAPSRPLPVRSECCVAQPPSGPQAWPLREAPPSFPPTSQHRRARAKTRQWIFERAPWEHAGCRLVLIPPSPSPLQCFQKTSLFPSSVSPLQTGLLHLRWAPQLRRALPSPCPWIPMSRAFLIWRLESPTASLRCCRLRQSRRPRGGPSHPKTIPRNRRLWEWHRCPVDW